MNKEIGLSKIESEKEIKKQKVRNRGGIRMKAFRINLALMWLSFSCQPWQVQAAVPVQNIMTQQPTVPVSSQKEIIVDLPPVGGAAQVMASIDIPGLGIASEVTWRKQSASKFDILFKVPKNEQTKKVKVQIMVSSNAGLSESFSGQVNCDNKDCKVSTPSWSDTNQNEYRVQITFEKTSLPNIVFRPPSQSTPTQTSSTSTLAVTTPCRGRCLPSTSLVPQGPLTTVAQHPVVLPLFDRYTLQDIDDRQSDVGLKVKALFRKEVLEREYSPHKSVEQVIQSLLENFSSADLYEASELPGQDHHQTTLDYISAMTWKAIEVTPEVLARPDVQAAIDQFRQAYLAKDAAIGITSRPQPHPGIASRSALRMGARPATIRKGKIGPNKDYTFVETAWPSGTSAYSYNYDVDLYDRYGVRIGSYNVNAFNTTPLYQLSPDEKTLIVLSPMRSFILLFAVPGADPRFAEPGPFVIGTPANANTPHSTLFMRKITMPVPDYLLLDMDVGESNPMHHQILIRTENGKYELVDQGYFVWPPYVPYGGISFEMSQNPRYAFVYDSRVSDGIIYNKDGIEGIRYFSTQKAIANRTYGRAPIPALGDLPRLYGTGPLYQQKVSEPKGGVLMDLATRQIFELGVNPYQMGVPLVGRFSISPDNSKLATLNTGVLRIYDLNAMRDGVPLEGALIVAIDLRRQAVDTLPELWALTDPFQEPRDRYMAIPQNLMKVNDSYEGCPGLVVCQQIPVVRFSEDGRYIAAGVDRFGKTTWYPVDMSSFSREDFIKGQIAFQFMNQGKGLPDEVQIFSYSVSETTKVYNGLRRILNWTTVQSGLPKEQRPHEHMELFENIRSGRIPVPQNLPSLVYTREERLVEGTVTVRIKPSYGTYTMMTRNVSFYEVLDAQGNVIARRPNLEPF